MHDSLYTRFPVNDERSSMSHAWLRVQTSIPRRSNGIVHSDDQVPDDGSLSSRFFRKVEKNLFRFASVGARARPSSLIEPIVIRSEFRAEGLAPPFDPFSIETRQLLTFGIVSRDLSIVTGRQ